ncbi:MAG: nicotinamidase [Candidatus Micrarchaeales archaeon]|jgi:nicotinamidase/pyrazinamidase
MSKNSALIVVDFQNDFCPGGALGVKDGDTIVSGINKLVEKFSNNGLLVVFTRDWHPANHCSFAAYGGIWPAHCVSGTKGAEFHPKLMIPKDSMIISKGTDPDKEAYSGFEGTELSRILKEKEIKQVFVCGLATDYCVKNTAADAIKLSFTTYLLLDCIKGVDIREGDSAEALKYLEGLGSKSIRSKEILDLVDMKCNEANTKSIRRGSDTAPVVGNARKPKAVVG